MHGRHLAATTSGLVDKEVLLTTTMLFTILCRIISNFKEAHTHMFVGLRLFEQWGMYQTKPSYDSNKPNTLLSVNYLPQIFLRMYYQTTHTRNWRNPRWENYCVDCILPTPFATVTDAFFELELIWHAVRVDENPPIDALVTFQHPTLSVVYGACGWLHTGYGNPSMPCPSSRRILRLRPKRLSCLSICMNNCWMC